MDFGGINNYLILYSNYDYNYLVFYAQFECLYINWSNGLQRDIEEKLISWKKEADRRPVLIRGTRQVGKTYTVREYAKKHFENIVEINFDLRPELKEIFSTLEPAEIVRNINLSLNVKIIPGQTLLFFDEIQECPKAIHALRYFFEKCPELHVIGAGSLLEFCLNSEGFRMPVGRVQYMHMKPLSFEEFLMASGEDALRDFLAEIEPDTIVNEAVHQKLLGLLRSYLMVGGMPAVVKEYFCSEITSTYQDIQLSILQTYRDDFGKYANKVKHGYLQKVFNTAPAMVGQRYKYSHVDQTVQSRELKEALSLLGRAGVVSQIHATSGHGLPFFAHKDERKFKVIFLDVGLMQRACGLDAQIAAADDFLAINAGAVAEQFVGQQMLACRSCYEDAPLFFWVRDKKSSQAEVDYLMNINTDIIPVEVKAGTTGTLKSLKIFMREYDSKIGVRFSQLPLSFQDTIFSIPLYAVEQTARLVTRVLSGGKK